MTKPPLTSCCRVLVSHPRLHPTSTPRPRHSAPGSAFLRSSQPPSWWKHAVQTPVRWAWPQSRSRQLLDDLQHHSRWQTPVRVMVWFRQCNIIKRMIYYKMDQFSSLSWLSYKIIWQITDICTSSLFQSTQLCIVNDSWLLSRPTVICFITSKDNIDGLVQERHNSIANAMELHLSCTNQLIYEETRICS